MILSAWFAQRGSQPTRAEKSGSAVLPANNGHTYSVHPMMDVHMSAITVTLMMICRDEC